MPLSNADVKRLERLGFNSQKFMYYDRYSFVRLQNHNGFCIFYDVVKHRCKIYEHRPSGCRIYPVIYSEQEGITLDDICPMKNTVSNIEIQRKSKKIMELLRRIDKETSSRRKTHSGKHG
jgi:Fe-S-cluster containining protein